MKKGQTIVYTREVQFKGQETIETKVVAVVDFYGMKKALLENGDTILIR